MRLSLEALEILDAIDRKGSFAAAAEMLDRVPSAITYSVRKLEEELDVLIFDRRGHRARLTSAGQELLEQGRHLLQAAQALEQRVQRTARGWESELRIVLDGLIDLRALLALIADFDRENAGTRLRFTREVLSGVWESLLTDRADLALGATHERPSIAHMQGDIELRPLPAPDWVFVVAPSHPLALLPEPLSAATLAAHRAVAVGDTGRTLPLLTIGLLSGQDTLTVPSLQDKLFAQLAGLGCGHVPRSLAAPYLAQGTLVAKTTQLPHLMAQPCLAWRRSHQGRALHWFLERLDDPAIVTRLYGDPV